MGGASKVLVNMAVFKTPEQMSTGSSGLFIWEKKKKDSSLCIIWSTFQGTLMINTELLHKSCTDWQF